MGKSQAQRVIEAFGGVPALAAALRRAGRRCRIAEATIYRWTYAPPRGTGGVIPRRSLRKVLTAADREGIVLDSTLLDPREEK